MSDTHATTLESHNDQVLAHPVPMRILLGTFGVLMLLTILTVAATWVDLGPFNIWLALLIAVIKGGLVAMYFMHLRWDSPFNGVVLIASLFFVALFLGITILDTEEYRVNYDPPARARAPPRAGGARRPCRPSLSIPVPHPPPGVECGG